MHTDRYQHILKKYNLTIGDIARMFGAKNEVSFRNSSAFKRYMSGLIEYTEHIESEIVKKIKE